MVDLYEPQAQALGGSAPHLPKHARSVWERGMTDKELLELAAKAAGLVVHAKNQAGRDACGAGDVGLWIVNVSTCWNPLTDDGDALRLAVRLRIAVDPWGVGAAAVAIVNNRAATAEPHYGDDPGRATRRAIVRAAAEIGRAMS